MNQVDPQSFGVAPQNMQGASSWVPPQPNPTANVGSASVSQDMAPNNPVSPQNPPLQPATPSPQAQQPPVEALSLGEIEVQQARFSLRYLFISMAVTVIVASLLTAYLSATQKAAAAQYSKKYDTEVATVLSSSTFQKKQKVVENASLSLASLQSELNSRIRFSNFFTTLSSVTYKNSRITRLIINQNGEVTLEGVVSSFNDLAKFTASLGTSPQFTNIRVLTAEKQTDGQVIFSVTFNVNNSLLRK